MDLLTGRGLLALGGAFVAWTVALPGAHAVAFTEESQLKAAFLYRFASFVSWPEEAFGSSPDGFIACVLGDPLVGRHLKSALEGKQLEGRPVEVRTSREPGNLAGCHLLYVDGSLGRRFAGVLTALGDRSVLTVGESSGFLEHGGVIQLVEEGSKLRFEVNRGAARQARLQISSRLLQLAANVR